MGARAWRLVAPPVFEGDGEKTRIARLLHIILLIIFVLVAVYTIISLVTDIYWAGLAVEAALLLIPLGLMRLSRRGKVQVASFILSLVLWGLISVGTYAYGGLQGSGPSSFFGVALIAGLLMGGRAAVLFALMSVLSLGGMLITEMLGVAPLPPEFLTPTYRWLELSTTIIGVGGLFYLVTQSLESALERARQNEREAVEASNFKSRLIARVSHELRTPLGAILGLTEMLDYSICGPLSPEQREVMQKVIRNTHRLNHLVADMLDQSRFESGKLRLRISEFSPREVVSRVVSALRPPAEGKDLALRLYVADDLTDAVLGDPDRVGQILYNLLNNAIKFTHIGAIEVRVLQPDNEYWTLQVEDTGIGIAEEARDYIFDPFRQVDESVTREYGGVGLGLAIVRQLVSLMDGDLMLESAVGQGSTFTVVLPVDPKTEG
jgi:signal transduction histidine kinase